MLKETVILYKFNGLSIICSYGPVLMQIYWEFWETEGCIV